MTLAQSLSSQRLGLGITIDINLPSRAIKVWSGGGVLDVEGEKYQENTIISNIPRISHDIDQNENRVSMDLAFNTDDPAINDLRGGKGQGSRVVINMVVLDEDARFLFKSCRFTGSVDAANMQRQGNRVGITLTCTDESSNMRRTTSHPLTDAAQQLIHPGDRGLEFATQPIDNNFGEGNTAPQGPTNINVGSGEFF